MNKLTTFLIIIILGLLIYLAFKPDSDKKYLDMIEKEKVVLKR
jgi:hypothetical protein